VVTDADADTDDLAGGDLGVFNADGEKDGSVGCEKKQRRQRLLLGSKLNSADKLLVVKGKMNNLKS